MDRQGHTTTNERGGKRVWREHTAASRPFIGRSVYLAPCCCALRALVFYAVEAFVVVLFVVGLLCGMRQRLLWLCLSWLGVDIFLHIILGFGLNEAYIMGTHWLFIIPIAIAFMFKRLSAKPALVLRWAIVALTLYLYVYNARLVFQFMSHPLTIG